MRSLFVSVVAISLGLSSAALAQSSSSSGTAQPGSQATAAPSNANALANAQKVKQELQNAGFKDVNVVAESFVVRAKTKDGYPIVMTIGPHGLTAFETIPANTTGSTSSSGTGTSK
jgi:hypothetical protein